jgi:hypothetical protein
MNGGFREPRRSIAMIREGQLRAERDQPNLGSISFARVRTSQEHNCKRLGIFANACPEG